MTAGTRKELTRGRLSTQTEEKCDRDNVKRIQLLKIRTRDVPLRVLGQIFNTPPVSKLPYRRAAQREGCTKSEQHFPSRSRPPAAKKEQEEPPPDTPSCVLDTGNITAALCLVRRRGSCPTHQEGPQVRHSYLDVTKHHGNLFLCLCVNQLPLNP